MEETTFDGNNFGSSLHKTIGGDVNGRKFADQMGYLRALEHSAVDTHRDAGGGCGCVG